MEIFVVPEALCYDGSQIYPLWAYETLGVRGDSIVVFQGPMNITAPHMRDAEDMREGKSIAGDSLVHFIVERFNSPASMRLAYYMQRLLIICIKDKLLKHDIKAVRRGDDLFVDEHKLTVSIATCGISSEKIHCGINITTAGVPEDVNAIGLTKLGIGDPMGFAREIAMNFSMEIDDIERDIAKTKGIVQ
jgi:hypothetical protein